MKKKVEDLLIELGIYPNLYGFAYICKAVEIISSNKERMKLCNSMKKWQKNLILIPHELKGVLDMRFQELIKTVKHGSV